MILNDLENALTKTDFFSSNFSLFFFHSDNLELGVGLTKVGLTWLTASPPTPNGYKVFTYQDVNEDKLGCQINFRKYKFIIFLYMNLSRVNFIFFFNFYSLNFNFNFRLGNDGELDSPNYLDNSVATSDYEWELCVCLEIGFKTICEHPHTVYSFLTSLDWWVQGCHIIESVEGLLKFWHGGMGPF